MDSRAFPRKHFVLAGLLGLGLCSFVLADLLYIEDSSEPAEETAALAPPGQELPVVQPRGSAFLDFLVGELKTAQDKADKARKSP